MTKNKTARFAALTVGVAVALSVAVTPASAQTVAELQAQIALLMQQIAALSGSSSVSTGGSITMDLTIGSSGSQVVTLQQALVSQGYLSMPAGVAMGYFGSLTKTAVAKWQAAVGLPNTGYFGPLSRAKFSGGSTGTVPGSTVGSGSTSSGVITTPGVEGTVTISKNPNPASGTKIYEGSSKVKVLGIKVEPKLSDVKIERVKIDLDTVSGGNNDQDLYNKIAQRIYVLDESGNTLASSDLNSSTVVKDGSDYFITLAGFSYVVPKDSAKALYVALDARSTWDSAFDGNSWSLGIPSDGVRAIDGAGINLYGPTTGFTQSFTTEGDLAESATLTVSTDTGTPQDQDVICTSSSTEDECDQLTVLKFNVKAEKDAVLLTDMNFYLAKTGTGSATSSTAYLYDGSTLVGSATILNQSPTSGGFSGQFTDIDYSISKDTTKNLTLKIDVQDTTIGASIYTASTTGSLMTAENSRGTVATVSGTGIGESIGTRKIGPEFSLVSKSITYTPSGGFAGATSSAKADFVIRMKAVGGDIVFGDSASSTYPLVVLGQPLGATATSSSVYRGGSDISATGAFASGGSNAQTLIYVSSSTAIQVPSGVTSTTTNSWTLAEGNTIDIPVSMVFNARTNDSAGNNPTDITTGAYAVQIQRLFWSASADVGERQVSDFMAGNSAWRTSTVTLP